MKTRLYFPAETSLYSAHALASGWRNCAYPSSSYSILKISKRKAWDFYEKKCLAKRRGEEIKKKKSSAASNIIVQRMSSETNRLKRFEPLDTCDFVDFSDFKRDLNPQFNEIQIMVHVKSSCIWIMNNCEN